MILLDTNVIIDALDKKSPAHAWAKQLIVEAVTGSGAAVNTITIAELSAGDLNPVTVETDLRNWGIQILDLPVASAIVCGSAYRRYRFARKKSSSTPAPATPLPDFFIGAHAEIMGWKIATRDVQRFQTYYPKVKLLVP